LKRHYVCLIINAAVYVCLIINAAVYVCLIINAAVYVCLIINAAVKDTSKQFLMKHILTSGFCPSDMTMKVSFSFHMLKTYAQFLMEAQVACYALQC
jgi:hypothetical protein